MATTPTDGAPRMTREGLELLMFGSGRVRRFTTDTPVLPDVWLRYAGLDTASEDGTCDYHDAQKLLLTPLGETPVGDVWRTLCDRLVAERQTADWKALARGVEPGPARLIYNQSTVAGTLLFADLIRVVLPLTDWWWRMIAPHISDSPVGIEVVTYIADVIRDPEHPRAPTAAEAAAMRTPEERVAPDVLWLVRIVGALVLLHRDGFVPEPLKSTRPDPRAMDEYWPAIAKAALEAIHGLAGLEQPAARIHTVSLNRRASRTVAKSTLAIKADAARRLFEIRCADLAWAIVDSGVDATHYAFRKRDESGAFFPNAFDGATNNTRVKSTFDFTAIDLLLDPTAKPADLPKHVQDRLAAPDGATLRRELRQLKTSLRRGRTIDWKLVRGLIEVPNANYTVPDNDHGTHVAGILAADWKRGDKPAAPEDLVGVCPDISLYDFRVLDRDGEGDEFNVMAALQFIRFLNSTNDFMAVHGANMSLSIPHDVSNYACGRTPVCDEAERVVAAGVVVVAAAGNQGYRKYKSAEGATFETYSSISITDPGNADLVITVGATHRFRPHTYGVSYFSSRGPTGDGRMKPDLVAPGEKIYSPLPNGAYGPKDGTSMAAPHVSGAAALLMARHGELVGRPTRVKQILCSTATDLGRERYFQGAGMLDVLRALQSV
jgi:serine protease AprX